MGATRKSRRGSDSVSRRLSSLLSLALVGLMLFLVSCTGAARTTPRTVTPTPSSKDLTAIALKYSLEQAILQRWYDSYGWMWNVSLPANRLVIYYGNPFSPVFGGNGTHWSL